MLEWNCLVADGGDEACLAHCGIPQEDHLDLGSHARGPTDRHSKEF